MNAFKRLEVLFTLLFSFETGSHTVASAGWAHGNPLCLRPLKGGIADALHHAPYLLLLLFCMSLCIHVNACAHVCIGI